MYNPPKAQKWIIELVQGSLREKLNLFWHRLLVVQQLPAIHLPNHDIDNMWLQVNPVSFMVSPITFSGPWMHISFGVSCRPLVALGYAPNPSSSSPRELPPNSGLSMDAGINSKLTILLPYDPLSKEAAKVLPHEIQLGHTVFKIHRLMVYSSEDKLVAAVDMHVNSYPFNASGWVYLWGKVNWDAQHNILYVTDFDFHPNTKDYFAQLFVKPADWFFHDTVRDFIAQTLKWDVTADLKKVRAKIKNMKFSQDQFVASVALTELAVDSVLVGESGLVLVTTINGKGNMVLS